MDIRKANEIVMAVQEGTAKKQGYTSQEIKDAKARMAQFNKNTKNDMMPGKARTNFNRGGYANCGASNPATQASTKKMYGGGYAKKK